MKLGKFFAAVATALGVGVSVTADGVLSLNDAFAIAAALVGAFAVYATPNAQS